MTPSYEKIIQLQPAFPETNASLFEVLAISTFIGAATIFFLVAHEAIKIEMEYRKLTVKGCIAWIFGWPYIKKWLQNTLFLFTDAEWDKKQCEWLKERQEERKEEVQDVWLKERLRREKELLMESAEAIMKTDKAMAKYECGECGYKDQTEMNLYAEISEAAKTFCYKQRCKKCKSHKLKIVMIECSLFKKV